MRGPVREPRGATQLSDGARCAYRHLIEGYGAPGGHAMMPVTSCCGVYYKSNRAYMLVTVAVEQEAGIIAGVECWMALTR